MSLLEIKDLEVRFVGETEDTIAVKNVSLALESGERLGLVGASGCGKSTLIHAILRSLQPPGVISGGAILFDGQDLCKLDYESGKTKRWKEISLVVQSALSALNPIQTIHAHFEDTLKAHSNWNSSDRLASIHASLDRVRLEHSVLDNYPHQLSGGMQQRVVIALAILLNPKLIIFDEPTTALDVQVERELLTELQVLQADLGFAALFISHDLDVIRQICQQVAVMQSGELVEVLPIEDLDKAKHPYTKSLLKNSHLEVLHSPNLGLKTCLQLKNIHQIFKTPSADITALNNVSVDLMIGESIGIVGASGSGKSTLGRIIAGLQQPTSGSIQWKTESKHPKTSRLMRWFRATPPKRVQLIFQNPFSALNPTMTIRQSLSLPLQALGLSKSEQTEALEHICGEVELLPAKRMLDVFPHELSGGQRQRVCIARAVLGEPDILIADEPTSMLDVSLRSEILGLLHRLRVQRQITLVLITHDLHAARSICERLIICHDGQIVERGPTEQIFENPTHPFTKDLLKSEEK